MWAQGKGPTRKFHSIRSLLVMDFLYRKIDNVSLSSSSSSLWFLVFNRSRLLWKLLSFIHRYKKCTPATRAAQMTAQWIEWKIKGRIAFNPYVSISKCMKSDWNPTKQMEKLISNVLRMNNPTWTSSYRNPTQPNAEMMKMNFNVDFTNKKISTFIHVNHQCQISGREGALRILSCPQK